jgi:hypothetical protein
MPGPSTTKETEGARRIGLAAALAAVCLSIVSPATAQVRDPALLLQVDLLEMSRKLEIRYRWAETGILPSDYILFGDTEGAHFLYPNFIKPKRDLRRSYLEYDPLSRKIYRFRVPGHQRFVRRTERSGVYFIQTPRPTDIDDMDISIVSLDARSSDLWNSGLRRAWRDDVSYALSTMRAGGGGRGGLIDINIPISPYPEGRRSRSAAPRAGAPTAREPRECRSSRSSPIWRWSSSSPSISTERSARR